MRQWNSQILPFVVSCLRKSESPNKYVKVIHSVHKLIWDNAYEICQNSPDVFHIRQRLDQTVDAQAVVNTPWKCHLGQYATSDMSTDTNVDSGHACIRQCTANIKKRPQTVRPRRGTTHAERSCSFGVLLQSHHFLVTPLQNHYNTVMMMVMMLM